MPPDLKARSIKGFAWSAGESFGVAVVSFASFTVMARTLEPRDFGVVALAGVFIYFFNLVAGHSFSDAVVQRRHLASDHLDTAFWSTLGIAVLLTASCQIGANAAAVALGEPALADVLRWLSLVLPLAALGSIQLALFRREMRFDAVAVRTLAGRSVGATVGISMALGGFGLWSLVGQQIVGTLVTAVAVASAASWRPRLRFSVARLREMWAFGFNVSANQVVTGAGEQAVNLVIGALFGSTALGFFNVAWRMAQIVRSVISSAVYHVGLSAFAKLQEDRAAVAQAFLQSTRISCLAGFPIGVGMALTAGPLTVVLFGDKWSASVSLLVILALEMVPAFYGMFLSALYRAMDKPAWGLGMAILYFAVGLGGVLALAPLGVTAIVIFWVARAVLLMPVHMLLVRRLLVAPMGLIAQPILVPLMGAAAMAAGILALRFFVVADESFGPLAELAISVPIGALLYGAVVWMLSPRLVATAVRTARFMAAPLRDSQ